MRFVAATGPIARDQQQSFIEGKRNIERILTKALAKRQLAADIDVGLAGVGLHASLDGILNNWLSAPSSFAQARR